jgi:SagB-type dehydrogenase family enzyme
MQAGRRSLKSPIDTPSDLVESDEDRGMEAPPWHKPVAGDAQRITLVRPEDLALGTAPLVDLIRERRSRRSYTEELLTLEELSFLLWAVQGLRRAPGAGPVTRRTVPASGGLHPFETYVVANGVEGVQPGLYRYLALEHELLFVSATGAAWLEGLVHACRGQSFVARAAAVLIWTAVPHRTEWRYANEAHKAIAQASGHACQNLYLAAGAIGAGTCAVSAYAQQAMDALLGVDGEDEFTIYLAPVGKVTS